MDSIIKVVGKLGAKLKLGGSPKDAITNLGGYLFPLAGLVQALITAKWLSESYQPLVVVLPAIGGVLVGQPGGKDQNLNPPVKISE